MRSRRFCCAAALALVFAFGVCPSPAEPIKIVSWNVEWFPGRVPDSTPAMEKKHIEEVRYALRRMKPDVLILLEVKNPEAVKKALRSLRGMKLNAISEFDGRPQQIAIASRFPMRRGGQVAWPRFFVGPPRGFTFAELELPGGKCLDVYGVHLKSNLGAPFVNYSLRELSAAELSFFFSRLGDRATCPSAGIVVGGDFNTSLDDPRFSRDDSLRYLMGSGMYWPFIALSPRDRLTWLGIGTKYEPIQFDHFLTKNFGAPKARVVPTGQISDHQAIEMIVETDEIQPRR